MEDIYSVYIYISDNEIEQKLTNNHIYTYIHIWMKYQ